MQPNVRSIRRRAGRWAVRSGRAVSRRLGPRAELGLERALLKRSWRHLKPGRLQKYLVTGYQSPLINIQSILARHHLIDQLAGDRFKNLERSELGFAVERNRQMRAEQKRLGAKPGQRDKSAARAFATVMADGGTLFMDRWRAELADLTSGRISVLEPACGSANDYRYMAQCGLSDHLDYRGFDLTAANIANAQVAHPDADFRIGDVLDIDAADAAFDWVVVHDLFEHLSPAACERAISEVCRVSRSGVLVSFFHMADIPDHIVTPLRNYYRNRLSLDRTREAFLAHCRSVDAIHISRLAADEFGLKRYYNSLAYTFIARK